jgi:hypothetical protein
MPTWSQAELSELGYVLRDFVIAGQDRREWLIARLAWRNTSNSEPVRLAAVRSHFVGVGKNSAAQPASNGGTTSNGKRSSGHGAEPS